MGLMAPEPLLEVILTAYGDGSLEGTKVAFQFRSLDGQDRATDTQVGRVRELLEHVAEQIGGLHRGPTAEDFSRLFPR